MEGEENRGGGGRGGEGRGEGRGGGEGRGEGEEKGRRRRGEGRGGEGGREGRGGEVKGWGMDRDEGEGGWRKEGDTLTAVPPNPTHTTHSHMLFIKERYKTEHMFCFALLCN